MALLLDESSGRVWTLGRRVSLGRAPSSTILLQDDRVSGEHASVFFLDGQFWVRDLASRNGTWVDGVRIPTGRNVPLKEGSRIAVGRIKNEFLLTDASAFGPAAFDLESGLRHHGDPDALWIDSGEGSSLAVVAEDSGWVLEENSGRRPVVDGQVIVAGGRRLRLELPDTRSVKEMVAETCQTSPDYHVVFEFSVSKDEESVSLSIQIDDVSYDLGERAHNYLLLLLARARLRDQNGPLAPTERGWISTTELPSMLATTPDVRGLDLEP